MPISELCNRDVVVVRRSESVREAIRLMRKHHIGDVVVVDEHRHPQGMLTDRDIVIELLAADVDLDSVTIGDAMSFEVITAREDDGLMATIERMQEQAVRRLPVVDDAGALVGILTFDDVIQLLARQLSGLARLIEQERHRESALRP